MVWPPASRTSKLWPGSSDSALWVGVAHAQEARGDVEAVEGVAEHFADIGTPAVIDLGEDAFVLAEGMESIHSIGGRATLRFEIIDHGAGDDASSRVGRCLGGQEIAPVFLRVGAIFLGGNIDDPILNERVAQFEITLFENDTVMRGRISIGQIASLRSKMQFDLVRLGPFAGRRNRCDGELVELGFQRLLVGERHGDNGALGPGIRLAFVGDFQ